jgi:predicted pyridoxine 5'-phosphate oxidase superfamily flavin-nucleotide-binding protein
VRKQMDRLDEMSRAFIAASPLLVISTQGSRADGMADCSPRGDIPGFVQVADDRTLLIADRRGDKRLDLAIAAVAALVLTVVFATQNG